MAISDLSDLRSARRLVLKVGSALLVDRGGRVRQDWLRGFVTEIAELASHGQQIAVVSSGAVALGAARLGLANGGRGSLADAQAAASVGQIALSGLWAEFLGEHKLTAAQMLVTLDDLEDRRRYLNAASTISRLLDASAVPVVNENDSVATEEIRFGDNDRLAARMAQAAQADAVVLLSDVDGLFDRNPSQPGAKLVPIVRGMTAEIAAMADGDSGSGMGSGGMTSKLQAAEIAERAGIALAIINGTHNRPLATAFANNRGTLFLPRRKDAGRKAWLGGRLRLAGTLTVDGGCAKALGTGSSLLAAGVTAVEGSFNRGDAVAIQDFDGKILAHGLAEYDADQCRALKGSRNSDHAQILGHAPRAAVVHRDYMVML